MDNPLKNVNKTNSISENVTRDTLEKIQRNTSQNFWMNFAIWKSSILFLLIIDQLTKYSARINLIFNHPVEVIPNVLNWRLLYNTGAAFSVFSNQTFLLAIISGLVALGLIIYSLKNLSESSKLKTLFLAFIISGAIGNLIDRVLFSQVTDFIDLLILPGNFAVFNFADVYINIAVALFIVDWFLDKK
ncbi:MAG: signal peptidase II [Candidatus Caenarcaniphilales bacterium]|nr:signal peptidase II [Candidatus Caenarcaniphilales bacterium]